MNKLIKKIERHDTATIKEIVKKTNNDFRTGAGMVFDAALDVLMKRLPEPEFVAFCEEVYNEN